MFQISIENFNRFLQPPKSRIKIIQEDYERNLDDNNNCLSKVNNYWKRRRHDNYYKQQQQNQLKKTRPIFVKSLLILSIFMILLKLGELLVVFSMSTVDKKFSIKKDD